MNDIDTSPVASKPVDSDIFRGPHKSIRHGLATMLIRLGGADAEHAGAMAQVCKELEDLLAFCEKHLEHEERVLRPGCDDRLVPEAFDSGHPPHLQMIAELRAMIRAVQGAQPSHRPSIAHALYLHYSVFVADCLQHMAEEERVLLPLMQKTLGDQALLAMRDRIMQTMSPPDLLDSARRMLAAGSPSEQRGLTLMMLQRAPRAVVMQVLEAAKPQLAPSTFESLVRVVEGDAIAQ